MNPNIEPTNKNHRILVLTLTVLLTAGVIGGSTYYVLNQQNKAQQEYIDALRRDTLISKSGSNNEATKIETPTVEDETVDWKTYTASKYGYSIKYPSSWVYKDYELVTDGGTKLVGFAPDIAKLAPEQSDAWSTVDIRIGDSKIVAGELTYSPDKLKIETVEIGNELSATKYTLSPGREDFAGNLKEVIYEIKTNSGRYVRVTNIDDAEKDTLSKMLETFKLL